jgi:hypothetical protein
MIERILSNQNLLLGISFVLFLVSMPLISMGASTGWKMLSDIGLATIGVAAAIPPLQFALSTFFSHKGKSS